MKTKKINSKVIVNFNDNANSLNIVKEILNAQDTCSRNGDGYESNKKMILSPISDISRSKYKNKK